MSKWIRTIGVLAAAGVLTGALVSGTPAQAAKKCKKFKPVAPTASDSGETAEAPKAKVQTVTDKYTENKPLTISYDHGPAFWWPNDPSDPTGGQAAAVEDTKWFNFQIDSKKKFVGLYIRQEWSETSPSDMDLYLYDRTGSLAGSSGQYNVISGNGVLGSGDGGMGYESINGLGVSDCDGYTVESRAFTTAGEAMTLKVWIGSVR
jgi:hypothetical protein